MTYVVEKTTTNAIVRHIDHKNERWWFGHFFIFTILFRSNDFIRAKTKFRSLIPIHSTTCMIEMIEIFRWDLKRRCFSCENKNQIIRFLPSVAASQKQHIKRLPPSINCINEHIYALQR